MRSITTYIIVIILILPVFAKAGEYDDLLFAAGLYGDGNLNLAQQELEKYLDEEYKMTSKFRMPEPSWHGHSQCFYFLEKVPELFYVDVLIEKLSADKNRFVESDRHGTAQIWVDKKNLLDTSPTPVEIITQKGKSMYKMAIDSVEINIIETKKNIRRKHPTDAMMFYGSLLNRHLAPLLNLKYRHHKYDFGIRYAWRAYPEEWHKLLEDLMFVKDLDDLEKKLDILIEKFYELVDELEGIWR